MRENKHIYTDVEKLSLDYERTRLSVLSPAEKEQLSEYCYVNLANLCRLETDIAEQRVFREIARNVLQGLILDSGLNWAGNEQLLTAMLLCGEEVEL